MKSIQQPKCPQCGEPLRRVTTEPGATYLICDGNPCGYSNHPFVLGISINTWIQEHIAGRPIRTRALEPDGMRPAKRTFTQAFD